MYHRTALFAAVFLAFSAGSARAQSQQCQQQMSEMNGCVKYEAEEFGMDGELPVIIQATIHQCFAVAGCAVPIFPIDPLTDFPPAARMAFDRFASQGFMTPAQKKCVEDSKRQDILVKLQQCTSTRLPSLPDWENDQLDDKTKRLKNLLTLEKAVRKCPQGGEQLETCIDNALAMQTEEFCEKVKSCSQERVNNNCKTVVLDMQDEVCGCAETLSHGDDTHKPTDRFGPTTGTNGGGGGGLPFLRPGGSGQTDRFGSAFPDKETVQPSDPLGSIIGGQNGGDNNNQGPGGAARGLFNFFRNLGGWGNSNQGGRRRRKRQFDFGEIFGQIFGGGGDFNIETLLQGFLRMIDPIGIFSGAFGDGMAPDLNVGGFGELTGGGDDRNEGQRGPLPGQGGAAGTQTSFGRRIGGVNPAGAGGQRGPGGKMEKIRQVLGNCGVNLDDLMAERKRKLMDSCQCRTDAANSVLQECLKRCREEVRPYRDIIHAARLRQRKPLMCRMINCQY